MKKYLYLLLFIILIPFSSNGSHVAGGDFTYQCIGGNTYLITLSFYRDCSGIAFATPVTVNYRCNGGAVTSVVLNAVSGTGQEITPSCPAQTTTCSGGSIYGIQQYVCQGQVTLSPCTNWEIYYQLSARNFSNTIVDPTNADIYVQATLNNQAAPCNSSPTFTNYPTTIICNGQPWTYNHGAVDPDGDSLSYSFIAPYNQGPNGSPATVTYNPPYSATQPLGPSAPITLNPETGDLSVTPNANITTVLAILVKEWRHIGGNIVCVGSVLRDMQLTVIACANEIPTLGGINPNAVHWDPNDTSYTWYMCGGGLVSFNIYSHDGSTPANNITITQNSSIPGSIWNVTDNNTPNPYGHFEWTPGSADVSNTPYCFTVTVKDDNCPYIGLQTFSYCIYVTGVGVALNLPHDTTLCQGTGNYTLIAHADSSATSLDWSINATPVTPLNDSTLVLNTSTLSPGTYAVSVVAIGGGAACSNSTSVDITIQANPTISITPANPRICDGGSIILTATAGADSYTWSPVTGLDTIYGQIVNASPTSTITYSVLGQTNIGCPGNASATVSVSHLQGSVSVTDSISCFGYQDGKATAVGSNGVLPYSYLWSNSQTSNPAIGLSAGNYTVTITDSIGCTSAQTVTLTNPPQYFASNNATNESCPFSCNGNIEAVMDVGAPTPYSYTWNTTPPQSTQTATGLCPGTYSATITYSPNNCLAYTSANISTNTIIEASFQADTVEGYLPLIVNFTYTGTPVASYLWDFGDGSTSNIQNPTHTYTQMGYYLVKLTVNSGSPDNCEDTYSITVHAILPSSIATFNAFTPNGDGKNDFFSVESQGLKTIKVTIFNRWGEKVYDFSKDDGFSTEKTKTELWDGNNKNGQKCADGTYFFLLESIGYDLKTYSVNGSVTIIR